MRRGQDCLVTVWKHTNTPLTVQKRVIVWAHLLSKRRTVQRLMLMNKKSRCRTEFDRKQAIVQLVFITC